MESKLHWHNFSFLSEDAKIKSIRQGNPCKNVTKNRIKDAEKSAGISGASVLISVSYLGYMTREEMIGE